MGRSQQAKHSSVLHVVDIFAGARHQNISLAAIELQAILIKFFTLWLERLSCT